MKVVVDRRLLGDEEALFIEPCDSGVSITTAVLVSFLSFGCGIMVGLAVYLGVIS